MFNQLTRSSACLCLCLLTLGLLCMTIPQGIFAQAPVTKTAANPAAKAQDELIGRGLTRLGNVYLLKAEIDSRDELARMNREIERQISLLKPLEIRQVEGVEKLANINQGTQVLNNRENQLRLNRTALIDQNNNQYQPQIDDINLQLSKVNQEMTRLSASRPVLEAEQREVATSLQRIGSEIQVKQDDLNAKTADLRTGYQNLAQNPAVHAAFKELNKTSRPWVTLGPESQYDKNIRQFAQKIVAETGFILDSEQVSVKVKRVMRKQTMPRLTMTAEKELTALTLKLVTLNQRVKKDPSDASRRELAASVVKGEELIKAVETGYQALHKDDYALEAAELLGVESSRLVPTEEFHSRSKRFADVVKGLPKP